MRSVRRDIVEPIAIVGTSLVSGPIAGYADGRSVAFSKVFAEALKDSRTGKRRSYGYEHLAQGKPANPDDALPPPPLLLHYGQSVDLYAQLDTLLREKSLLIAVV